MRRIIIIAAVGLLAIPAGAGAAERVDTRELSPFREKVNELRSKVDRQLGREAGGLDILKYGVGREGHRRPARHAKVVRYRDTLLHLIAPPPAPAPAPLPASAAAAGGAAPAVASGGAPADSGGGGCYGLPGYIVQRESGGDPNARNGRYGGCAQVDDAHFAPGGDCAGMSYGGCVHELMRQGISKHWPTAANPPR